MPVYGSMPDLLNESMMNLGWIKRAMMSSIAERDVVRMATTLYSMN